MKDDFYSQFENSFRGERSEIKARLLIYYPFIEPLINLYPEATALDLGCGRGEWLEVLRDKGLKAQGVDLDDSMLDECRKINLDVFTQDAIAALNRFDNESLSLVTAFHLVEHIPFDMLRALISETFRALKPGGLLILETPNPENIMVGTSNFYLDPTHTRPIPPGLLKFLVQYNGFMNCTVLGLQELPELYEKSSLSLKDVLGGVSPDYAVIAQKPAPEYITDRFKPAFIFERGLSLDTLISRYDQYVQQDRAALIQKIETVNTQNQQDYASLTQQIETVNTQNQQDYASLTQKIETLHTQIHAIFDSSSWKITRPLRALGNALRYVKKLLRRRH